MTAVVVLLIATALIAVAVVVLYHGYLQSRINAAVQAVHERYAQTVNGAEADANTIKLRVLDIYHAYLDKHS